MKISINMAVSIDGKIATKFRGPVKLGSAFDTEMMSVIRSRHQAVLNGATTFKVYPFPLHVKKTSLEKQPISAIVSSALKIPKNTPWEKAKGAKRWVFCGAKASSKRISELMARGIVVVQSKKKRPGPKEIAKALAKAGVKSLLLEGGGELNASFLEAGLVNTIYLTLCPIIVGGSESPSFVEGNGFLKAYFPQFRLKECKRRGNELYLVYKR